MGNKRNKKEERKGRFNVHKENFYKNLFTVSTSLIIGKAVNLISACFVARRQRGGIKPKAIKADPTITRSRFAG
jgi:hypothetical protein